MWHLYHGCNRLIEIERKTTTKIYREKGRKPLGSGALLPLIRSENFGSAVFRYSNFGLPCSLFGKR